MNNSRTLKTVLASILLVVTLFTFAGCQAILDALGIKDVLTIEATYVGEPVPVGGALLKDDILVEATLLKGLTKQELTYEVYNFIYSPLDSATPGEKTVQVTYTELGQTATDEITITVFEPVVLVGIEAIYVGAPLKVGETLTAENFLVQAVYSDGSKVTVTNFTFSSVDTSTAGIKTTTISYVDTSSDFSVTLNQPVTFTVVATDVTLVSISATIDAECWEVGYVLQNSDFVVTATFSDDHTSIVTDFTIVSPTGELTTAGQVEVELSYTYQGETRYTTVTNTVIEPQKEVVNYGKYGILSKDGKSVKIADTAKVVDTTDLQIHFLELGNQYTGDCTYIKAGDVDILIDAGSRKESAKTIGNYIDQYVTDGTLEYVIVTHAHQDHIAGFVGTSTVKGIFSRYVCENIIDFPRSNATSQISKDYASSRNAEVTAGANHYTALDCWNNNNQSTRFSQSVDATGARRYIKLSANVEMEILYNYYYENKSSDENDYSVCIMINQYGENYDFNNLSNPENEKNVNHFLLTGDLEEAGEKKLVENNTLPEVVLFKGGHHGSYTASSDALLSVIKPKVVCVCCCTGTYEFKANPENTFPAQAMINRVAKHTDLFFATSLWIDTSTPAAPLNGNITLTCNHLGINLTATNNITMLKDTDWFKANRICPTEWQ
ncbi:MAG: MBL fold metallo-hydrolase [Clostridia bacterium]|nr:MBL fold metallo-hydrolase [Clostridia bacterium]